LFDSFATAYHEAEKPDHIAIPVYNKGVHPRLLAKVPNELVKNFHWWYIAIQTANIRNKLNTLNDTMCSGRVCLVPYVVYLSNIFIV